MTAAERAEALSILSARRSSSSRSILHSFLGDDREHDARQEGNQHDNDMTEETQETPGTRGTNRYQTITDPDVFPTAATGLYTHVNGDDSSAGVHSILHPYLDVLQFPFHPNYHLKGDVDSLYTVSSSLTELLIDLMSGSPNNPNQAVEAPIPPGSIFTMPAVHSSSKVMQGSRFSIDTSNMACPPTIRNQPAKKISLERFPSLEIGQLSVGLHRPMQIYLVNLAAKKLYKSSYFSKTEMAVVNAASNIARQIAIHYCREEEGKDYLVRAFLDFHPFKSCYGSQSNRASTRFYNELTNESMAIFASSFLQAISLIADNSQDWEFQKEEYHQVVSDTNFSVERNEMVLFAKELQEGALFVASLSGIKKVFDRKEFCRPNPSYESFKDQYQTIFDRNQGTLVREANQVLAPQIPYATNDEMEHLDNDSGPSQPLLLEKVTSNFPSFDTLFGSVYMKNIEESFYQSVDDLCIKIDTHLKTVLGIKNRNTSIFFDIGIEVRLSDDNSLLVNPKLAFPDLKAISLLE